MFGGGGFEQPIMDILGLHNVGISLTLPAARRPKAHSGGATVKKFNAQLQQAINKVDWGKVQLPCKSC